MNIFASTPAITGGDVVAADNLIARSIVGLYIKSSGPDSVLNFCTATVVRQNTLITAGHCISEVAKELGISNSTLASHVFVGLGTDRVNKLSDVRVHFVSVKETSVDPDYDYSKVAYASEGQAFYDVAVVKVSQPLPSFYKPVKLVRDPNSLKAGTPLILAGFGLKTGAPDFQPTTELRAVKIEIDNPAINPVQFSYKVIDHRSACSGDSGGPAYFANADNSLSLAGATSWGDQACSTYGAYTSIPAVIDWLDSQIPN